MSLHNVKLFAYNPKSEGAKQLANALGIKRLRHENSRFKACSYHTVINWGSTLVPEEFSLAKILNKSQYVKSCTDKLEFFRLMDQKGGPKIPPYTTEVDTALEWLGKGNQICIRTILNSSGGNGLFIIRPDEIDLIKKAPLYTMYIKKKDEYRIHFAFGQIIDAQRKALRSTDDEGNKINKKDVDFRIRNVTNGFIFARQGLELPEVVKKESTKAFKLTSLDFGAVDVIYNEKEGKAYVLEINTAPGLCGQTVESYTKAFKEALS